MFRHLDLFSGIGGFALAAQMVGGIQTTQFVEIDRYCQKILNKNFAGVPIHDDIRTYTANLGDFDVITFGSPCQDFSGANANGRGLEGERSGLFFEAIRVLRLVRPQYAIFENVANVLRKDCGRHFQQILRAFYESGYDAEWQVISAASLGAPHLRERLFIVAYTKDKGAIRRQWEQSNGSKVDRCNSSQGNGSNDGSKIIADSSCNRIQRPILSRASFGHSGWSVEPAICRVDARIPHRVDRLKGLGNSVVPQVAAIAFERVFEIESGVSQ